MNCVWGHVELESLKENKWITLNADTLIQPLLLSFLPSFLAHAFIKYLTYPALYWVHESPKGVSWSDIEKRQLCWEIRGRVSALAVYVLG